MSKRIRTIKPEWLDDEKLAAASDEARVLSVALILMADDYGRGRAALANIAAEAWRYQLERDDGAHAPEILARASRALRELVAMQFVALYEVGGQRYFAIRTWAANQRVDKPSKPRVPPPPAPETAEKTDTRESDESASRDSREEVARDHRDARDGPGPGPGPGPWTVDREGGSATTPRVIDVPGIASIAEQVWSAKLAGRGGRHIGMTGDGRHFRAVAEAADALRGVEPLRAVLERWADEWLLTRKSGRLRVEWWAEWATERAASGAAPRIGPRPPSPESAFRDMDDDEIDRRLGIANG